MYGLEVLCLVALTRTSAATPRPSITPSPKESSFALSVSVFRRHESGDIVGDDQKKYRLEEHVDYLGLTRYHATDTVALLPYTVFNNSNVDFDSDAIKKNIGSDSEDMIIVSLDGMHFNWLDSTNPRMNDENQSGGLINQGHNVKNNKQCKRGDFCLSKHIFLGGHGEIWRGNRITRTDYLDLNTSYILKRMHIQNNQQIQKCAEREIYFGNILKGDLHFTQLDSYFSTMEDIWLVFVDNGISLNNLIYAMSHRDSNNPVLQPSILWRKMRTTSAGQESMKSILQQIIKGVAVLHDMNILHRDIKPSNILVDTNTTPRLVIADFSSAVSETAILLNMYDDKGPSRFEETESYSPPEVLLSRDSDTPVAFDTVHPLSYDVWSIGVTFLELLLGTDDVFSVDQRTAAMMQHRMRGASELKLKQAMLLASWSEFCIFSEETAAESTKVTFSPMGKISIKNEFQQLNPVVSVGSLAVDCGLKELSKAILRRDVLGLGYDDYWGLDLLRRLLQWNPADRIDLRTALKHAYFCGPYVSDLDGSEHGTEEDLSQHNYLLMKIRDITDETDELDDESRSYLETNLTIHQSLLACLSIDCSIAGLEDSTDIKRVLIDEDPTTDITFECPHCHRRFNDWKSCYSHLVARKHGVRCLYNSSRLLPCISLHSLLPIDPYSGWCDYTGRRKYIEDYHSILFADNYKYFGVFDGHQGNRAARYASKNLHTFFEMYIHAISTRHVSNYSMTDHSSTTILRSTNGDERWGIISNNLLPLDSISIIYDGVSIKTVVDAMYQAFADTHTTFMKNTEDSETSGTTSTVAVLFEKYLLLAHVGDSRAVFCCNQNGKAVQLTVDHTPKDSKERLRIEAEGGFVETSSSVLRVNGVLAVTRSLGDKSIPVVSSYPDLLFLNLSSLIIENYQRISEITICGSMIASNKIGHFLIVASDGLWDVVTNDEAIDILCDFFFSEKDVTNELPTDIFQKAAQLLAQEAFVRGSMDNIGVCIIGVAAI